MSLFLKLCNVRDECICNVGIFNENSLQVNSFFDLQFWARRIDFETVLWKESTAPNKSSYTLYSLITFLHCNIEMQSKISTITISISSTNTHNTSLSYLFDEKIIQNTTNSYSEEKMISLLSFLDRTQYSLPFKIYIFNASVVV